MYKLFNNLYDFFYAQKIDHLNKDYVAISKHILYIENAIPATRLVAQNLTQPLENVNNSMYTLLCKLDTALRSQGSSTEDTRKTAIEKVKIDNDSKNCSNYIYVSNRATQKLLEIVIRKYENFLNQWATSSNLLRIWYAMLFYFVGINLFFKLFIFYKPFDTTTWMQLCLQSPHCKYFVIYYCCWIFVDNISHIQKSLIRSPVGFEYCFSVMVVSSSGFRQWTEDGIQGHTSG